MASLMASRPHASLGAAPGSLGASVSLSTGQGGSSSSITLAVEVLAPLTVGRGGCTVGWSPCARQSLNKSAWACLAVVTNLTCSLHHLIGEPSSRCLSQGHLQDAPERDPHGLGVRTPLLVLEHLVVQSKVFTEAPASGFEVGGPFPVLNMEAFLHVVPTVEWLLVHHTNFLQPHTTEVDLLD